MNGIAIRVFLLCCPLLVLFCFRRSNVNFDSLRRLNRFLVQEQVAHRNEHTKRLTLLETDLAINQPGQPPG